MLYLTTSNPLLLLLNHLHTSLYSQHYLTHRCRTWYKCYERQKGMSLANLTWRIIIKSYCHSEEWHQNSWLWVFQISVFKPGDCFAGRCCVTFCNVGGLWKMSPLLKSQNLQSSCAARAWSLNNIMNTKQVPYTNGDWNYPQKAAWG